MNLPLLEFLVIDTETTGFVPKVHRVIEVAAILVKNGEVKEEYSELLSLPEGTTIPSYVQMLTHIRPEDLEGKPEFSSVLSKLQSLIGKETIVVGQNTPFDLGMLRGEGWDLAEQPWIDTSMLASLVFPELPSYSLGYLSKALKLGHEPEHRALGDTRATFALLQKCVERLAELPNKDLDAFRAIAVKGSPGYSRFFAALPKTSAKRKPAWVAHAKSSTKAKKLEPHVLSENTEKDSIQLVEEPLHPDFPSELLLGLSGKTWFSVKNIEAAVRKYHVPPSVHVLYPPEFLLSLDAVKAFASQEKFTADEATLAMKLSLYEPKIRSELPLHGGEYELWRGKLAADEESPEYKAQMAGSLDAPALLNHEELLEHLEDSSKKLPEGFRVVLGDASMLEDTATHASSFTCHIPTLRASAEGNPILTKCVDLVELWAEKTRSGQDLRYLAQSDLETKDSLELKDMIASVQSKTPSAVEGKEHIPEAAHTALTHLLWILDPENLPGRLSWIENWQDGSKTVKSVLEDVSTMLDERLYGRAKTTLLIPKGSAEDLRPILPLSRKTTVVENRNLTSLQIEFPIGQTLDTVFDKPEGKTILLMNSKRSIEELYVRFASELEEKGVRFLCQGFSGGSGRMQAEFDMAPSPAIMVQTPWTYEGVQLERGSVDRLIVQQLPFDHPSHPVVSRRAARFKDPFLEYSLPRLLHRLFRLVRTFLTHASKEPTITVLDDRIRTREYGRTVKAYLESLVSDGKQEKQEKLF